MKKTYLEKLADRLDKINEEASKETPNLDALSFQISEVSKDFDTMLNNWEKNAQRRDKQISDFQNERFSKCAHIFGPFPTAQKLNIEQCDKCGKIKNL
jgi:predicted  nucleic acid-binding Zn-ribbon protein